MVWDGTRGHGTGLRIPEGQNRWLCLGKQPLIHYHCLHITVWVSGGCGAGPRGHGGRGDSAGLPWPTPGSWGSDNRVWWSPSGDGSTEERVSLSRASRGAITRAGAPAPPKLLLPPGNGVWRGLAHQGCPHPAVCANELQPSCRNPTRESRGCKLCRERSRARSSPALERRLRTPASFLQT